MGPSSCRKTISRSPLTLHYGELYNCLTIYHNNNRNKVHNKGNAFESSQNYPLLGLWKSCFSWNESMVPKTLGVTALKNYLNELLYFCLQYKGMIWNMQMVKNLPTMQETQVLFLGPEDPLEKEMTTHSSTLPWKKKNPMDRGAWWATIQGLQRVRDDLVTITFTFTFFHLCWELLLYKGRSCFWAAAPRT